jgi:2-succinyl-5-enolpyruvyl-6-hydroxy-3-cyclohexene-1-carboxylate synthase
VDPVGLATKLAGRVTASDGAWAQGWTRAHAAAGAAIESILDAEARPTEPGVHALLGEIYSDGDLVYTASSMPIRDQEGFLGMGHKDVRFLCNRGANGIDGLISSGIGAAAASGRPTWILTGDLGLFHDMNALESLRTADSPVRIVVFNNDGGGIFEFLPQASEIDRDEFEALFGTAVGVDPAGIAALHGIPYTRLEHLTELRAAGSATGVIEVPVDRRANVELHRRLAAAATAAVEQTTNATEEAG